MVFDVFLVAVVMHELLDYFRGFVLIDDVAIGVEAAVFVILVFVVDHKVSSLIRTCTRNNV